MLTMMMMNGYLLAIKVFLNLYNKLHHTKTTKREIIIVSQKMVRRNQNTLRIEMINNLIQITPKKIIKDEIIIMQNNQTTEEKKIILKTKIALIKINKGDLEMVSKTIVIHTLLIYRRVNHPIKLKKMMFFIAMQVLSRSHPTF